MINKKLFRKISALILGAALVIGMAESYATYSHTGIVQAAEGTNTVETSPSIELSSEYGFYVSKDASGNEVNSIYMTMGQTAITLTAKVTPADTTDMCEWVINDAVVADIKDDGYKDGLGAVKITPKKVGSTYLTVTCGKVSIKVYVYVRVPVTQLSASTTAASAVTTEARFELPVKGKDQIKTTLKYNTSTYTTNDWKLNGDTVLYESSDPKVATVDEDGNIVAISKGVATITVATVASKKSVRFVVTVVAPSEYNPLIGKSIKSVTGAKDIYSGQTLQLGVVMDPVNATNIITWEITKGSATISPTGLLTAGSKPGAVTVKATMLDATGLATNVTATATLNVKLAASSVNLTNAVASTVTLYVGNAYTLTETSAAATTGYYVLPANSTDGITCISSDKNVVVASVSGSKFTLTAKAPGTSIITLKAASGVSNSFTINVKGPITAIALQKTMTMNKGQSTVLTPSFTPVNSTDTLKWSTSNKKVAVVSPTGIVTAVGPGKANITVKAASGKSAVCKVTVMVPASKVYAATHTNQKKLYMVVGSVTTISYKLNPFNSTDSVTYYSTKPNIVSIVKNGKAANLNARKKGTAKIVLTTTSGKKATITVKVVKKTKNVKKIKITGSKSVAVRNSINLTAKLSKASSTNRIRWSSNNPLVATVNNYGCVTGVKKGTVMITASTDSGKSKKIKITVQ